MLSYFLFILYILVTGWWLSRMKWINDTGINKFYLLAFYVVKIASGSFYGYWYSRSASAVQPDTWRFHEEGLKEYHLLFQNPSAYFSNLFHNEYQSGWGRFFTASDSYWNDLRDNLMVKFVSLMDVFSGGNYYVNVVIYSFITFFAFIFLYKAFSIAFGSLNKLSAAFIFLTPSCLFWTSGIHKDGLILLFLSIAFYQLAIISSSGKIRLKNILLIALMLIIIFPSRNYISLGLIPCILALFISIKTGWNSKLVFTITYLMGALIFFGGSYIHPKLNFPQKVVYRQMDFNALEGNSRLAQQPLEPTTISFIRNAPQALDHSLLRPYPWQAKSILELASSFEVLLLIVLFLAMLLYRKKQSPDQYKLMLLFFSFSMLLLIGYTVPFAGSIVRYRSIYFMLLFVIISGGHRLTPIHIK